MKHNDHLPRQDQRKKKQEGQLRKCVSAGGEAIVSLLLGERNFGGALPMTIYPSVRKHTIQHHGFGFQSSFFLLFLSSLSWQTRSHHEKLHDLWPFSAGLCAQEQFHGPQLHGKPRSGRSVPARRSSVPFRPFAKVRVRQRIFCTIVLDIVGLYYII